MSGPFVYPCQDTSYDGLDPNSAYSWLYVGDWRYTQADGCTVSKHALTCSLVCFGTENKHRAGRTELSAPGSTGTDRAAVLQGRLNGILDRIPTSPAASGMRTSDLKCCLDQIVELLTRICSWRCAPDLGLWQRCGWCHSRRTYASLRQLYKGLMDTCKGLDLDNPTHSLTPLDS